MHAEHGGFFDAKDVGSLGGTMQHSSNPNCEFVPRVTNDEDDANAPEEQSQVEEGAGRSRRCCCCDRGEIVRVS